MKLNSLIIMVTLLTACQSMQSDDPSSLAFSIPKGSTLTLNKNIEIPEGKAHAIIQHGKIITNRERDIYYLNCNFEFRELGARTIKPEEFTVRRAIDGRERISRTIMRYYTEVYLESSKGTDVIMLECQVWADRTDSHFTVSEMQQALGDNFSFKFAERK